MKKMSPFFRPSAAISVLAVAGATHAANISGTITYAEAQTGPVHVQATATLSGNYVLALDGDGDFVDIPTLTDLSGSEITIQYWFKGALIQSAVRQQSGGWIVAGWNNLHILSHDGGTDGIPIGPATDGKWHHIVMTWKQGAPGGFASYLDGVLVARRDAADAPLPNHNAPVYFGSFNGASEFTSGSLDEIAIWNRALDEAEVRANWYKPLTGNEAGLVGYWDFQNGWPDDLSPNQHHGNFNGDAWTVPEDIPGLDAFASTTLAEPGPYSLTGLATGQSWEVRAFRDPNGNQRPDPTEPYGVFAGNPINLTGDRTDVDILLLDRPAILTEPQAVRVPTGGIATFTVAATGSQPLSFQWRKDEVNLANNSRIQGAQTDTLTITDVLPGDQGSYSVLITNPAGAAASKSVSLTVIEGGARISGNLTYDGAQTGDIVITAAQVIPANQVLTLDGDGDCASTTLTDLSGSELTIQFWFRGSRVDSAVRQQAAGYIVAGWGADQLHLISNDGGTDGISVGASVTDGNWHQVTVSWKQNTPGGFSSYLDGQLVQRRDSSNTPIPNHQAQVYFGAWNGTSEFAQGSLDEIAIWNRALSETEIANNWNRPLTGTENGLAGYWNFDDGLGQDLSGYGNHAELWGDAAIVDEEIPGFGGEFLVARVEQPGPYSLPALREGSNFQVTAFLDANGNDAPDPGEPSGAFAGNPFDLSGDRSDVDIELTEPPRLLSQTIQGRGAAGGSVVLTVSAVGSPPLLYQWQKDGVDLSNGGNLAGAQAATLQISSLSVADQGDYRLIVSNAKGQTLSRAIPVLLVADGASISGTVTYRGEVAGNLVIAAAQFPPDNQVLDLTGATAHVVVDTLRDLSGEALTIEYWFRGSSFQSAVRQQSGGFIVSGWNGLHILSNDGGTGGVSAGPGVTDGRWHHVLMTWELGALGGFASYLDGRLVVSRDSSFDAIPFHDAPLYFGAFNGASEFADGQLDQIAVWQRAFTEAEVAQQWGQPLTGNETGLVGYWDFDDGTADDRSVNAHHGTLVGATIVPGDILRADRVFTDVLDQAGPYTLANVPVGSDYHVFAYLDLNGNGIQDEGEPAATFSGNPFNLTDDLSSVDLDLGGETEAPLLAIGFAGGEVTLSWPADAVDYSLETTANLGTPEWVAVPGVAGNSVTLPATEAAGFYRLRKWRPGRRMSHPGARSEPVRPGWVRQNDSRRPEPKALPVARSNESAECYPLSP